MADMKKMENDIREMKATYDGQMRIINNITGHAKNQGAILTDQSHGLQGVHDEAQRSERLAKQV